MTTRFRLTAGLLAGLGICLVPATMTMTIARAAAAVPAAAPDAASCERLAALALPATKITSAQTVAAGTFTPPGAAQQNAAFKQLPAFCRVVATLTPSADSHIEMELWLPVDNWNGKFLAVGNGGWAGTIVRDAIATGLRRGYAAASNDTGHQDASIRRILNST